MKREPETIGTPPDLVGKTCDALLVQQYWYNGMLEDEVNVVFICAEVDWHRVCCDCGVVFWRNGVAKARTRDRETHPPDGHDYPILDVGTPLGVVGVKIETLASEFEASVCSVAFSFADGRQFSMVNENDRTTMATQPTLALDGPALHRRR